MKRTLRASRVMGVIEGKTRLMGMASIAVALGVSLGGCGTSGGADDGADDDDTEDSGGASGDNGDDDDDDGDDDDDNSDDDDDDDDDNSDNSDDDDDDDDDDATTSGETGGTEDTGEGDSTGGAPEGDCTPFPPSADFAAAGPFPTVSNAEGPACTIFRPEVLGEEDRLHPVIVWGNGTFAFPQIYQGVLGHWASHGFVVAAANTSNAGSGVEMIGCLDYLEEQNETPGSVYEGTLDLEHVATSGHSQGGGGSIMAGRDPRVSATAPVEAYTAQGFGGYDQASQSEQNGPMFLISGAADTTAPVVPHQQRVWDTANVPVFWGIKDGATHTTSTIGQMPAFRHEITAWMRYQLMCDDEAAALFTGDCTLCTDPEWEVQTQGL